MVWYDNPEQYQHPGLRAAAVKAKREAAAAESRTDDANKFISALRNIDAGDLAVILTMNVSARNKVEAAL